MYVTNVQYRPLFKTGRSDGQEMSMEWVTRERPKIDRIACPWLILGFIDAQAQFHYVPADQALGAWCATLQNETHAWPSARYSLA
jgi:ChrB, C-terminal domain